MLLLFQTTSKLPVPGVPAFSTEFTIQGHRVTEYDFVAQNGAWHVIDTVLDPRKNGSVAVAGGWEDWEEWVPKWADEE